MWGSNSASRDPASNGAAPLEIKVRDLDAERKDRPPSTSAPLSMGWLLRLFRSDFFDAFMAVTYLYRYRDSRGVYDYLCNQLYALADEDLEAFMPQVCNLLVHHARDSPALERFVMDKCAESMHIALQVFWFLQAAVEDAARMPDRQAEQRCRLLRTRCETAALNGSQHVMLAAAASQVSAATLVAVEAPFSNRKPFSPTSLFPSNSTGNISVHEHRSPSARHRNSSSRSSSSRSPGGRSKRNERSPTANDTPTDNPPATSSPAGEEGPKVTPQNTESEATSESPKTNIENSPNEPKHSQSENLSKADEDSTETKRDSVSELADSLKTIEINNTNGDSTTPADASEPQSATEPRKETEEKNSTAEKESKSSKAEREAKRSTTEAEPETLEANASEASNAAPVKPETQPVEAQPSASGNPNQSDEIAVETVALENLTMVATPSEAAQTSLDIMSVADGLAQSSRAPRPKQPDFAHDFDPHALLTMKKERFDYFNDSLSIAKAFVRLSLTARDVLADQRQAHLVAGLESINDMLLRRMKGEPSEPLVVGSASPSPDEIVALGEIAALRSVHLPLTRASSQVLRILRVHSDEVIVLTSRTRVPFMVNIEVLPTKMLCADKLVFCEQRVKQEPSSRRNSKGKPPTPKRTPKSSPQRSPKSSPQKPPPSKDQDRKSSKKKSGQSKKPPPPRVRRRLSEMTPAELQRANVRNVVYGDMYTDQPYVFRAAEEMANDESINPNSADSKARHAVILGVYGELWSWKEERILKKSPFNKLKGTKLMPFIVKAGDDLRQEQLAIQLIAQFKRIFDEEGVEVFLKPFTVMSVSSESGFVEVLTDAVSVHSLKKRTPNFVSMLDYFERAYGKIGTASFRAAQRRFIRSMAGYSLVTYFLQIKDRHNGNIMMDAEGHIVHIDFGFMLTNSPGSIKFENVPFKLTEEYLQVICAMKNVQDLTETSKSEGYRYFQEQFVLGLLAARKHYEKITTLVEIMTEGTTMPCMTGGHSIVEALRARFAVGMPEQQCISFALALIEESRLSWRSASYDKFQAYSNGYR